MEARMASSITGLTQAAVGGGAGQGEAEDCGGAAAAAPGLFSERDVLDLMRLKKPLLLDSRFFSGASGRPELEPLLERLRRVTA